MAKAAVEPGEREHRQSPVVRSDAVANAASDARIAIARLLRLIDPTAETCWLGYEGRAGKGRFPIDIESVQDPVDAEGMTEAQRAIVAAFQSSPVPLTRKEAAMKCGYTVPEGRFGMEFRSLLTKGKILKRGSEYTDAPSKFEETI